MSIVAGPPRQRVQLWALLALLVILAFAFQGSRGLWDPDEGRYTNVALRMLKTGNYLLPSLDDEHLHFSKPPLTYFSIAASVYVFGENEWAVRLPNALAFVATGLLVYGLGLRLVPRRPWLPALIYATSLGPFAAANIVTADALLTLWETLAVFAFIAAWFSQDVLHRKRYLLLMWCGFGLAFATKGPPGLLPLLPIVVLRYSGIVSVFQIVTWPGLVAFATIGLSWFVAVIWARPDLLEYFLRYELYDRVFSSAHDRNAEWYGAIKIYSLGFLVGTLPWFFWMIRPVSGAWRLARRKYWRDQRDADPTGFFLRLWLLLPLAIFCIAQSRLYLYILPLFVPIALLLARRLENQIWLTERLGRAVVGFTVAVLLGVKCGAAIYPHHKDARNLARLIAEHTPGNRVEEIVFLQDWPRYGLSLYLGAEIESIPLTPPGLWCDEAQEPGTHVYVVPKIYIGEVYRQAASCGHYVYVIHRLFSLEDSIYLLTGWSQVPNATVR